MLQPNCSETCEICGGYIECYPECPNYFSEEIEEGDTLDFDKAIDLWFEDASNKIEAMKKTMDDLISKGRKANAKKK